jgi:MFS family permease
MSLEPEVTIDPSPEEAPAPDKATIRKVAVSTILGGALEWFDYFVYAQAAALVLPTLFFAGSDPVTAIILSFGGFAVGQFARPIGSFFLGNLGDKVGRRTVLIITYCLMGGSTFLMGCLPTYQQVGVLAPVLLIVLRIAQGFGAGAEFAGASVMMLEYAPTKRRGLFGSVGAIGSASGLVALSLVNVGLKSVSFCW